MILKYKASGDTWCLHDGFHHIRYEPAQLVRNQSAPGGFDLMVGGQKVVPDILHYTFGDIHNEKDGYTVDCLYIFCNTYNDSRDLVTFALPYAFILNDDGKTIERI